MATVLYGKNFPLRVANTTAKERSRGHLGRSACLSAKHGTNYFADFLPSASGAKCAPLDEIAYLKRPQTGLLLPLRFARSAL
jgi:hypothetical protein